MDFPVDDDWPERSAPVVAYYRDLLIAHTDDLVTQVCLVCQVHQCEDWRVARDWLANADELTAPAPHHQAVAALDRKPRS